ncbi:MAG: hypothetical protein QXU74_03560, partial [Candidatus Aenigmatarchaeota archaeon]
SYVTGGICYYQLAAGLCYYSPGDPCSGSTCLPCTSNCYCAYTGKQTCTCSNCQWCRIGSTCCTGESCNSGGLTPPSCPTCKCTDCTGYCTVGDTCYWNDACTSTGESYYSCWIADQCGAVPSYAITIGKYCSANGEGCTGTTYICDPSTHTECESHPCGGSTRYCTQNNGAWGWWSSSNPDRCGGNTDGCYAYGNGCEIRDYYCSSGSCTYSYSNRNTDTACSYTSCSDDLCDKTGTYIDYYCDGGSCIGHSISCSAYVSPNYYCSGGSESPGPCGTSSCPSDSCSGSCPGCTWRDYPSSCNKYCDGSGNCASCSCSYTSYDPDNAQSYCSGCGISYWAIGGDDNACCGDDSNNYRLTRVCDSGVCTSSSSDDACCNANTKCVYNSVCYASGYSGDVNGDGWAEYCSSGTWKDGGKPRWSNNTTYPTSPATYSPGAAYQFNITWIDNIAVDEVIFEFNSVNYSYKKGEISKTGNIYNITLRDLAANPSGYSYKWYANDTCSLGNWNSTPSFTFVVNKASPSLSISGTGTYSYPNETSVSGSETNSVDSDCTYNLYRNGSSVSNPDVQTLEPGIYNYTYNNSACTNFTSGSTSSLLTITRGYLTVTCEAGGPYLSGATVIVKGNFSTLAGLQMSGNVNVTIGLNKKYIIADSNGTFYTTFTGLSLGTHTVTVNSTASFYDGSCTDTVEILSSGQATSCIERTIGVSGVAIESSTGDPIPSGSISISILDTRYTNSTTFTGGSYNISLKVCLEQNKRYIVRVAVRSDTGKTGLYFFNYIPT